MNPTLKKFLPLMIVLVALTSVAALAKFMPKKVSVTPPRLAERINVVVEEIKPIPVLNDTLSVYGIVEPNTVVEVPAEVPARVEHVDANEGQRVKAGQVLVRLNTELLSAEYDRAVAESKFDEHETMRLADAVPRGAATSKELEQAQAKAAISKAVLAAAKTQLDRATIFAPAAGVLNRVLVDPGEFIRAGEPVAQIVDIDKVKVVVQLPEADVRCFRAGQDQAVLPDGDANAPIQGVMTYISELADTQTRTTRAEISVDNKDHRLHSGQIVQVQLNRGELKNVVMIPLRAVIPLEDGYEVFVVDGDKAAARRISLGFIKGDRVQALAPAEAATATAASSPASSAASAPVKGGLAKGDLLMISGHRLVSPGQGIRIENDK